MNDDITRFSILLSISETNKNNYPSHYFIRTLVKIVNCYNNILWENIEIIILEPSMIFKLYFLFLRVYIPKNIWDRIVYYKDIDELKVFYEVSKEDFNTKRYDLFLFSLKKIYNNNDNVECGRYDVKTENKINENVKNFDL